MNSKIQLVVEVALLPGQSVRLDYVRVNVCIFLHQLLHLSLQVVVGFLDFAVLALQPRLFGGILAFVGLVLGNTICLRSC